MFQVLTRNRSLNASCKVQLTEVRCWARSAFCFQRPTKERAWRCVAYAGWSLVFLYRFLLSLLARVERTLTCRAEPMILVDDETLQSFDPTPKPSKGIEDQYYATVEVYHQLHCLDITRKFIWRDHYAHVDTFQDPPEMVWEHVGVTRPYHRTPLITKRDPDHCIDLLRQTLMCHGDVGLFFYTDVGDQQPVARVSTTHMCRNFSGITEWVNKHDSESGVYSESRSEWGCSVLALGVIVPKKSYSRHPLKVTMPLALCGLVYSGESETLSSPLGFH